MDEKTIALQWLIGLIFLVGSAHSLYCHQCNQRGATMQRCHHGSTIENCNLTFPNQSAVCLKIVRTFASGRPSAVFAACDLREEFSETVLGACHIAPKPKESNSGDRIEMCICLTDYCNHGATVTRSTVEIFWIVTYLHIFGLLAKFAF